MHFHVSHHMHAKMSFRMTVIRYIIETKEPKVFTCPGIISLGTEWIFSVQGSLDFTHQPWNTHSCPSMQSTFRTSLSLNNINVTLLFRQKHFHRTKHTVSMKQENSRIVTAISAMLLKGMSFYKQKSVLFLFKGKNIMFAALMRQICKVVKLVNIFHWYSRWEDAGKG